MATKLARSISLLHSAEQQLRIHNTDGAIGLLGEADTQLAAAHTALATVPAEDRFVVQKKADAVREMFEDFRVRMCQL